MKINPLAFIFWLFCAGVGYLLGDTRGAVIGVTFGLGASLLFQLIDKLTDYE